MEKICKTCDWHDDFSWACCNGDSPYCADFTDDNSTCNNWRKKGMPEKAQNESKKYSSKWSDMGKIV